MIDAAYLHHILNVLRSELPLHLHLGIIDVLVLRVTSEPRSVRADARRDGTRDEPGSALEEESKMLAAFGRGMCET